MYKIIGADQKEYGPVSADQIRQWIVENRANAQTMVLPEGAVNWIALGALPEFAPAFAAKTSTPSVPIPVFAPSGTAIVTDILNRSAEVDIGRCLSRAWSLWTKNLLFLVGVNIVAMLVVVMVFLISGGVGIIPLIGTVLSSILFWAGQAMTRAG